MLAFKGGAIALMIAAPLAGVWIASSLAAFANRATWLPVVCGLLLFPGLPLAWEGFSLLRSRKKITRRFLTFSDRLILRTLAVNALFLVVLLAAFPSRAFVALSTRGDWMLDGRHGATAEATRRALLTFAGAMEWLYNASNDNPYKEGKRSQDIDPTPTPVPTSTAKPIANGDAGAGADGGPGAEGDAGANGDAGAGAETEVEATPHAATGTYPWPETLHPAVVSMPKEIEISIESVGKYISSHEPDPMLRVKALHDWVVDRIAYDVPAYEAHAIPPDDYDGKAVFRRRVGVCAGYAELMVELGKASGDEILYLRGDARSQSAPMEGEGHAWNAVRIAGAWYLIDTTWDAGSPVDGQFKKKYGTEYLFTPPAIFAVSHFPDAAKWQLLERPLSRVEFFRRPVLAPAFFVHGLELRSPSQSQVSTRGSLDLAIDNPRGAFLLSDFRQKGGGAAGDCKGDHHTAMHCDFPAAGTYDVRLYASGKRYGTYDFAGSVQVNARP